MIAVRIVVPADLAERTLDLLCEAPAVTSVVPLKYREAAGLPRGRREKPGVAVEATPEHERGR